MLKGSLPAAAVLAAGLLLFAAPLLPARAPAARSVQEGALAAVEAYAAEAGIEALAAGGNAVDAAVATGFALAVTYPLAGNLGGGGFLLYRSPDGEAWFLDFRETAPAAATRDMYAPPDGAEPKAAATAAVRTGWKAVAVPGSVPGLLEAHERWGNLPREFLLAPAIRLAREGIPVSRREHETLQKSAAALRQDPLARRIFFDANGDVLLQGERLVQPELAETLEEVRERGAEAFRSGAIVDGIVAAAERGGGVLSGADLSEYRPVLRPVERFAWRDVEVLAASPPSSGGVFLRQALYAVEGRLGAWGDARTVQMLGEATARAFAWRNRWLGDPAGMDRDWRALVSPAVLEAIRAEVSGRRFTPPDELAEGAARMEAGDTTHFSVVDGFGGACSVTTTLNGAYGAKVMAPGGFLMNNEMDDFAALPGVANQYGLVQGEANAVRPGRRPLSSMSPVIVLRDGELDAVLGSPGGSRILSSVLQVLLHRYRFGFSAERAVRAPRIHRQDRPADLWYECGRLAPDALTRLRVRGQPLRLRPRIGCVNAVFRSGDGWVAVGDPRREGVGLVLQPATPAH